MANVPRIDELVGVARQLARVTEFEAAEQLMLHFGGQQHYVPVKMRPKHPFWKVLGKKAALEVASLIAAQAPGSADSGTWIEIPTGSKLQIAWRKAAISAFKGSKNEAASIFKCTRRTVQRYRKADRVPLPLFDATPKRG